MNSKEQKNECEHHYLMTVRRPAMKDGVMTAKYQCLRCCEVRNFVVAVTGYIIRSAQEVP